MLNLLLTILIILVAYYFYKKKHAQDGAPSQPNHYELLDNNGNPVPSSGNRSDSSILPTLSH